MSIALSLYVREADGLATWVERARGVIMERADIGLSVIEGRLDEARKHGLCEALGFEADAFIQFELDTSRDVPAQMQLTVDTTLRVLEQHTGAAALVFNGEVIYLVRRDGQLLLNEERGLWTPERVALISGPYQRQRFAVIRAAT